MRNSFIKTLTDIAKQDPRVVLLTGDLGFSVLEEFQELYPTRFYNCGVSEQNMVGLATGLAEAGYFPFVYSIATFSVLRPFEFIRNGPVLHRLPVRIVGVGAGYEYGDLGTTHHLIEDIALMRSQIGLTTYIPFDPSQAQNILLKTYSQSGPIYYRLGKDEKRIVPELKGDYNPNSFQTVGKGKDLCLVTTGSVTRSMLDIVPEFEKENIKITVLIVDSIDHNVHHKLLPTITLFDKVISVEDHVISGGIGSVVAETIAEKGLSIKLRRLGCHDKEDGIFGCREFLYKKHGMNFSAIKTVYGEM
ncbi:MAG: transketolase family protein [Holosporales bacterium]